MSTRPALVVTIGPASSGRETFVAMVHAGLDIVRFNFAWSTNEERAAQIAMVRDVARELGREIKLLQDLPGPRVQTGASHTYDQSVETLLTEEDERSIAFGVEQQIEYLALSFVGNAKDVEDGKALIKKYNGTQKVIAKIERKVAIDHIDEILAAADGLMVARGDLGSEVPLEEIPFIEKMLIEKANAAGKPVIVATQMLLSMTESPTPSRAEVTDVAWATLLGADGVMLSEESASGKYPTEAVTYLGRIAARAAEHAQERTILLS
ncbi:MAG: pyruvate kinase [Patescibacteria group bacterium]|jgi:pyruvate kinase|nr:pyruvate kinase [Patescibacteria group bacterium]